MEYELDINANRVSAEVRPLKEGQASVVMGGRTHDLSFERISQACLQLRVNGRQVLAWAVKEKEGTRIVVNGRHFLVRDLNLQDQAGRAGAPGEAGQQNLLTPPMPAIVIQVPVALQERVKKGAPVVVVSAMKMETTLSAPYDGVVTRIGVKEGDKVMPGDILADIEPDDPEKGKETP